MKLKKWLSIGLVACLFVHAAVADPAPPSPRSTLRNIRQIATPDGIEKLETVRIGGIDQWVSIRGHHRDAPILLFLHGGPGFTSIPTSFLYMQGWEEYFTVVQYDQRGAGKTFATNDSKKVTPTLTIDRMVDDAEEMAAYLRKTYGRKRIVLVGHSWGTVLGVKLAQRHPDWFYAYVGIEQAVDMQRSEALGYTATLEAARADHNAEAVAELTALAPYPDTAHPDRTFQVLGKERHWLAHYNGYTWHAGDGHDDEVASLSPDYSEADLVARDNGKSASLAALMGPLMSVDFTQQNRFACPVVFFHGRHDLNVSAQVLEDWFNSLQAPSKKLVWFEDSGHLPIEEEPGKVLISLVQDVLPLTR